VSVTVLVLVGLYLILALEASGRWRGTAVGILCLGLLVVYIVILLVPALRDFFALASPKASVVLPAVVASALAIGGLAIVDDRFVPGRTKT
jgi:hypothetical protein